MTEITAKTPWEGSMGGIPMHLDYFDGSMFEAVERIAMKYPRNIAFDFMGRPTTYSRLVNEIKNCARALRTIGVRLVDHIVVADRDFVSMADSGDLLG